MRELSGQLRAVFAQRTDIRSEEPFHFKFENAILKTDRVDGQVIGGLIDAVDSRLEFAIRGPGNLKHKSQLDPHVEGASPETFDARLIWRGALLVGDGNCSRESCRRRNPDYDG